MPGARVRAAHGGRAGTMDESWPAPQPPTVAGAAAEAQRRIQHALSLARRGAVYSARAEFVSALNLLAQTLDAHAGGNDHSRHLANGLRALREAREFVSEDAAPAAEIDVASIVAAHQTPVLRQSELDRITPLEARQRYYCYATAELAKAAGGLPGASGALFGLGKLSLVLAEPDAAASLVRRSEAMALFRAALEADAQNYLAANELGVLLAQQGHIDEARRVLRAGLRVHALPEMRRNLAVLEQPPGARVPSRAVGAGQSVNGARHARRLPRVGVHWVSPEAFARTGPTPAEFVPPPAAPARRPGTSQNEIPGANSWGRTSWLRHARHAPPGGLRDSAQHAPVQHALALVPGDAHAEQPGRPGVQLCQGLLPAPSDGTPRLAVGGEPFARFAQGEYVGPARTEHVPEYRLRVGDQLEFVYRLTRVKSATPYRLNVGDVIVVESMSDTSINRGGIASNQGLVIQPDGTITLPLLGQVQAAGLTVEQLRRRLDAGFRRYVKQPQITVTPLRVNTRLEDLRAAVDSRYGVGGQSRRATVTPEGTVQLPALGSVPAQGLTLDELKREIDQRYAEIVQGIEVTPILLERAPRYIFVVGEVANPGRFVLEGPTTVMQAIAMAGSWNVGADLRRVLVFRRLEDWRLIATRLDLRRPLLGRTTCPADEIWLRDSDLVVVPKSHLLLTDDWIDLIFTRGIYGVLPVGFGYELTRASTL